MPFLGSSRWQLPAWEWTVEWSLSQCYVVIPWWATVPFCAS